jgi:hypothetical protein
MAVSNELNGFVDRLKSICKLIGPASIESDYGGDRWIDVRSTGQDKLWGQIRSTHNGNDPVWEIIVSDRHGFDLETVHMERKELNYGE